MIFEMAAGKPIAFVLSSYQSEVILQFLSGETLRFHTIVNSNKNKSRVVSGTK
jgi:hypothetical protein